MHDQEATVIQNSAQKVKTDTVASDYSKKVGSQALASSRSIRKEMPTSSLTVNSQTDRSAINASKATGAKRPKRVNQFK